MVDCTSILIKPIDTDDKNRYDRLDLSQKTLSAAS